VKSITNVIRLGLVRGWIEFRIQIASIPGFVGAAFVPVLTLVIASIFRDKQIEGVSLALFILPGFLSVQLAGEGLTAVANRLPLDREDGTLLRAKALPQGMVAYLIARAVMTVLSASLGVLLVLLPGFFIVPGLAGIGGAGFVTLGWVLALGLFAIAPLGAMVGALVKTPTAGVGLTTLALVGLTVISGIFYPITALPAWLQWIGQLFPLYWLGLGLRSVCLPATAAARELGGSWRPLETALVLAAWTGAGLLLAPGILRRMARHTSGSDMEAGRRRYTQRSH
jgi:ABC-2 type transport system permease protein